MNLTKPLMISMSGIRGIVGENLTPEIAVQFGKAFGTYLKNKKVVIGTDTRTSREIFENAVISGLLSVGVEVINLGICPTPTIQLMINEEKAGGGIVISASHNPSEWNGLKWYLEKNFNSQEFKKFFNIFNNKKIKYVNWKNLKPVKINQNAFKIHINKILNSVNVPLIKKKNFKVVLDSCNGAGSIITPFLLEKLGCEVIKLNCSNSGLFVRNPEPLPQNLKQLCRSVLDFNANIGFAQDPDADRLAIVSEQGIPIGEENTLALTTKYILKKRKGKIVVNLSTSRMIDDIAMKKNVIRTKIGENNVVLKMKEIGAIWGGEGNGGVIDPLIHYCRDSLIGIGIILQYLAEENKTITQLLKEIPQYYILKTKIEYPKNKIPSLISILNRKYKNEKINMLDGIKIDREKDWIHIRPSNTEPILRIIIEAKNKNETQKIYNEIKKIILS